MSFNFKVNVIGSLLLTSSLLCISAYSYAIDEYSHERDYGYQRDHEYQKDTFSPVKNAFESISSDHEQIDEEQFNFPFKKSSVPLPPEDVVGLRFINNKQISLSKSSLFYIENFDDYNFAKFSTFKKYPNLLSIELNGFKLTEETLEHLQIFMPKKLFSLLISDCIIDENGYELLVEILTKRRKTLASIILKQPNINKDSADLLLKTISKNCDNNFITIAEKIRKSNLQLSPTSGLTNLDIMFNIITSQSLKYLTNILEKSSPTLQTLSLSWNNIAEDEQGNENSNDFTEIAQNDSSFAKNNKNASDCYKKLAKAFEKLKKIKKLELSIVNIPEDGIEPLLDALKNAKNLEELRIYLENTENLDKIKLFKHVEVFAHSLKKMHSLKKLDISAMNLPANAMQVIFHNLKKLENLEVLNISQNHLDKNSIQSLCDALTNMKELKTFIANGCDLTKENFQSISSKLANLALTHIFLRGNRLENSISNIVITKELQVLDLADNNLTFEDAASLAMKTQKSRIQFINFKDNPQVENFVTDYQEIAKREAKKQKLAQWRLSTKSSAVFFGLE